MGGSGNGAQGGRVPPSRPGRRGLGARRRGAVTPARAQFISAWAGACGRGAGLHGDVAVLDLRLLQWTVPPLRGHPPPPRCRARRPSPRPPARARPPLVLISTLGCLVFWPGGGRARGARAGRPPSSLPLGTDHHVQAPARSGAGKVRR